MVMMTAGQSAGGDVKHGVSITLTTSSNLTVTSMASPKP